MISKLFNAFANTVLERTLPSVRAWLVERLGDRVSIDSMEAEGTRIHLVGARLPLGASAQLQVERATFQTHAADLARGRPPARLESLVGALVVPAEDGGEPLFHAPLELEAHPAPTGLEWVYGTVTVRGGRWRLSTGQDEQAPLDGEITLRVTSERWALESGRARAKDATIELEAEGRSDTGSVERARLSATGARTGHFIDAIAALAGREVRIPLPLPWLGRLSGAIELTEGARVSADVTLVTEASELHLVAAADTLGAVDSARLEGHLALADVIPESLAAHVSAADSAPVRVEGVLGGALEALNGRLDFTAESVVTSALSSPLRVEGSLELGDAGRVQGRASARAEGVTAQLRVNHEDGATTGELDFEPLDAATVISLAHAFGGEPWVRLEGDAERETPFAFPKDASLSGELEFDRDRVRGALEAVSPRSLLQLHPIDFLIADQRVNSATLTGELDAQDAVKLGLFPGPIQPEVGAVTGELELRGAFPEMELSGPLETDALTWRLAAFPDAPPVALRAGRVHLFTDAERVVLSDLRARLFGGALSLTLDVPYEQPEPAFKLTLEDAAEELSPWLEALSGRSLPSELSAAAALETDELKTVRGRVVLSRPGARLEARPCITTSGSIEGTELDCAMGLGELYSLLPKGGPVLAGKGEVTVRAALEGTLDQPAALMQVELGPTRAMVANAGVPGFRVELEGGRARFHVDARRLVMSELGLSIYGGRVDAKGLYAWAGSGFRGLQAKARVAGLELGRVPIPGQGNVGEHVTGALHAELSVVNKRDAATARESLRLSGPLTLERPTYPALRRAGPSLARLGLDPPTLEGRGPLTCEVRADGLGIELRDLNGAVRRASLSGDVRLDFSGVVSGQVHARIGESYLRTSTLLSIPAVLVGDLQVPVSLSGTVDAPEFEPDYGGALDQTLGAGSLSRGLVGALGGLVSEVRAGSSPRAAAPTPPSSPKSGSASALIERIAAGVSVDLEDDYVGRLLDYGLSPDEIATRIEDARTRRR